MLRRGGYLNRGLSGNPGVLIIFREGRSLHTFLVLKREGFAELSESSGAVDGMMEWVHIISAQFLFLIFSPRNTLQATGQACPSARQARGWRQVDSPRAGVEKVEWGEGEGPDGHEEGRELRTWTLEPSHLGVSPCFASVQLCDLGSVLQSLCVQFSSPVAEGDGDPSWGRSEN